ncbi:MAG: hypothetical protein R3301_09730 [Saprospiraceae bacterium]|nr:hypothetical protein [Saprospiraceae bacterium]
MKKLTIIFAAGLLILTACKDDALSPIITFDKAGKGAYVRLLTLISGEYDLSNFSASAFEYEVEFVDEQQGSLVSSYDIYVSFDDNSPGNGDNSKAETLFASFGQGDFGSSSRGYKSMSVSLPLSEAASKLGLAQADLTAGDFFRYRTELVLNDGRVFTRANSTAAVNGSAFQGFFNFNAKCTCPLPDDRFTGSYKIEYVTHEAGPFGAIMGATPPTVTLRTVSGSTTLREFDWVYLPDTYYFDGQTWRFDFVCDEIQLSTMDTGVGCGGGSITIVQDGPIPVDITDDSSFEWAVIEYANDGGCGVDPNPLSLRFTKQ